VTTKPFERELYTELGANNVLFVLQSFDTRFLEYQPLQQDAAFWSSDLCFVGHFEKHYAGRMQSASDIVSQTSIWGPGWERYARRNNWARTYVKGGAIWGDDYLRALAHAKIALGLLSKWIPETTTTRSFEIPAMGIFLLAERTEDHLALFEESKEAEFFGDDEELKDKLRFYLAHDEARNRIAAAGRERCLRSGYSSPDQLKSIIQSLN
jgi:spore maturation protein CgeB